MTPSTSSASATSTASSSTRSARTRPWPGTARSMSTSVSPTPGSPTSPRPKECQLLDTGHLHRHYAEAQNVRMVIIENSRVLKALDADLRESRGSIRYRLRRAEEILGHDLGTDLSSLHTALLAADLVGGGLSPERTAENERALASYP